MFDRLLNARVGCFYSTLPQPPLFSLRSLSSGSRRPGIPYRSGPPSAERTARPPVAPPRACRSHRKACPKGCSDDEFPWAREGEPLDTKYLYVTHSELNAILNYRGGSLEGAKMYVTLFPCNECAKAIIQAGIKTLVYDCDKYASTPSVLASKRMLDSAGVRYYQYKRTGREISLTV